MKYNIENHLKHFEHAALWEKEGRLYGWWFIGNNYKAKHGYHGEYPPTYIERVKTLFPDHDYCLHLFSGSVIDPGSSKIDINPTLEGWDGDVQNLSLFVEPRGHDLIMADPPYTKADAEIYGYPMPNKPKCMREIRKVIRADGVLVWLDIRCPMFRRIEWSLAGVIGLHCGTNRVVRGVYIFEPMEEK